MSAFSAAADRIGVGATADRTTRASCTVRPSLASFSCTATPTTAMSISRRGTWRTYAPPVPAPGRAAEMRARISPLASTVWPGPRKNWSSGTDRSPDGPTMWAVALSAMRDGDTSAEGAAVQRFPAIVARLRIWIDPIRSALSVRIGQPACTAFDQATSPHVTIAPISSEPFAVSARNSGIRRSATTRGTRRPRSFIWISKSVPPASGRESSSAARISPASRRLVGAE